MGYLFSEEPGKRRARGSPENTRPKAGPLTQNNNGFENRRKIPKACGGKAGSRKASWRRKCPSPKFSSRGNICYKTEVHDIINLMFLEIKCEML